MNFFHVQTQESYVLKIIKAMLGMLGGGESLCSWVFMMELLLLGYHCMRT